jgi:hypothetical protein
LYHSNSVKKKEENGGTSPVSAYEVKKMNSLGRKSSSGMAPHCTLSSYPDDCHPSSRLSFVRSLPDQKREAGRMDANATNGGWDLEGGGELKNKERRQRSLGARKQNEEVRICL